jgi:hypothetical protein
LKSNPRATIGNAKKEETGNRPKSPGPSCYNPDKLMTKRKSVGVIFNKEQRKGIINKKYSNVGPGSYLIPC